MLDRKTPELYSREHDDSPPRPIGFRADQMQDILKLTGIFGIVLLILFLANLALAQQFPAGRNRRENGVFWGPSS